MMERQRPHSKVSVEDLLRLKRAEKPAPEFWTEFETRLRYKQLAAIVDKRPWWRRVSLRNLGKLSVPIGATAALVLTALTVRQSPPTATPTVDKSARLAAQEPAQAPADVSVSAPTLAHRSETAASREDSVQAQVASAPAAEASPAIVHVATSSSTSSSGAVATTSSSSTPEYSLAQVILGLEGSTESDARPQFEVESGLLSSLQVGDFRPVVERRDAPLAQPPAATPQDSRRARLLAYLTESEENGYTETNPRVARSRERITRRLSEQALYDSISRLGLNGDSVTIRF